MYIMLGFTESIAIELTASDGNPVFTSVQALAPIPPEVDFHSPPEAEPINTMLVSTG